LNWIEESVRLQQAGRPFAIATIVAVAGSTSRDAAAHMLVEPDGTIHGTIGGGSVEDDVIQQSIQVLQEGTPRLQEFINDGEDGRPMCGGKMQLFIEPFGVSRNLYIFGGGHVGSALARIMIPTSFNVTIIDEREDYPRERFPGVNVIHADFSDLPPQLIFNPLTSHIVVLTYSHEQDLKIVRNCLRKPWHYLGMIASRVKAKQIRETLLREGVDPELLKRLISPIGLPGVGSKEPAEIAVSIAAQLLTQSE
jgi:xanthine dehydrogenase accessory factor